MGRHDRILWLILVAGCGPNEPTPGLLTGRGASMAGLSTATEASRAPTLQGWQAEAARAVKQAQRKRLGDATYHALLADASGYALHAPELETQLSVTRTDVDRIEARIETLVSQRLFVSDTPAWVFQDRHMLEEETGWFTSSDDCRRTMVAKCALLCSHSRLEVGNHITLLWDGRRRDVCRTEGDLINLGGRRRALWCAAYERHPDTCTLPHPQAAHPVEDCVYRPVDLAAKVVSELTCVLQGDWKCSGQTSLSRCQALAADAGPPTGNACDILGGLLAAPWAAWHARTLGTDLSAALDRVFEP